MMVVAVRPSRLVARNPVARVDALDQPEVCQRLQSAVDGRDPDRPTGPAKPVEDLLRAHAAVLPAQELDDRAPCAPAPEARSFESVERMTDPDHVRSVSSRGCFRE